MASPSSNGRLARAQRGPAPAYVKPARHVVRRPVRPANDNDQPMTRLIERTARWLVPVMAFGLLGAAVITGV